jgi:hypothetical protein
MNESKEPKENRKKTASESEESQQPVKVVRRGAIAASVWKRQAPSGYPYYDFSLSRSWKSLSTNKTGYSKNFFADHAKELAEVIQETSTWIESQKAQDQGGAAVGALAA